MKRQSGAIGSLHGASCEIPIVVSRLERRYNTIDGLVALIDERIQTAQRVAYNEIYNQGALK